MVSHNFIDLTGKIFNRLTVIDRGMNDKRGTTSWNVQCSCGSPIFNVRSNSLKSGNTQSCGCLHKERIKSRNKKQQFRDNQSKRWGRLNFSKNSKGYMVKFYILDNGKTAWLQEHILVMEKHLGRPLVKGENVHHINGIRDDNRIENLELWSTSQPSGQRVQDKTEWAIEWLKQYKPEVLRCQD